MMNNSCSLLDEVPDIPLLLEIEPTSTCNLRCLMCHVPTQDDSKPEYLDMDVLERQTEEIKNCHLIVGSEYESTIHPRFDKLLRLIIKRNWKLDFLSNSVRLHTIDQGLLADVPFHIYNASFDGFSAEMFNKIRVGADYNRVKQNILRMSELVKKNGALTAINSTMLRSNLHETKDLVQMWNSEGIDLVRLLVMQVRDTKEHVLKESLYPVRLELVSVLNDIAHFVSDKKFRIGVRSGHYGSSNFCPPDNLKVHEATIHSDNQAFRHVPGVRQDFLSGTWPGMEVPCRSPFVYCRIRWDGNVDLCNKRENVIGSIYDDTLSDIWHGNAAKAIREKIKSDKTICEQCDFLRFCIGSRHQDYLEKESHFANGVLDTSEVKRFIEESDSAIS